MKTLIRVLLCLGSLCIIIANWPAMSVAFVGGCFFFLANILSLFYNVAINISKRPKTRLMKVFKEYGRKIV